MKYLLIILTLFILSCEDDKNCTIINNGDGTKTLTCPDGYTVTIQEDNPTHVNGSVMIFNNLDYHRFKKLEEIKGSLYISASFLHTIEFPNLTKVSGQIFIYDLFGIHTLSFPELEQVTNKIYIGDMADLQRIFLPKLKVTYIMHIVNNDKLNIVDLSSLERVTSMFKIQDNIELSQCFINDLIDIVTYGSGEFDGNKECVVE